MLAGNNYFESNCRCLLLSVMIAVFDGRQAETCASLV